MRMIRYKTHRIIARIIWMISLIPKRERKDLDFTRLSLIMMKEKILLRFCQPVYSKIKKIINQHRSRFKHSKAFYFFYCRRFA